MKKVLASLILIVLMLQSVFAVGVGLNTGVIIEPEKFAPRVFMDPNSRIVLDDPTEPGQISGPNEFMIERINNYAFEGEQIIWDAMVWDKNGVPEKLLDVYVKLFPMECGGLSESCTATQYIEVNCNYNPNREGLCLKRQDPPDEEEEFSINAVDCPQVWYEGEEELEWNPETMGWYTCHLTVETPVSMFREYAVNIVAIDLDNLVGQSAEQEVWFFNPEIALGMDGTIDFGTVRPGGVYKSSTVAITNNAQEGSGVLLDMFLAGTDFYDPAHAGTMCPTSNVLLLENFAYYASQGAYNTCSHPDRVDAECYVAINHYMDGAGAPVFNNFDEIIEGTIGIGPYETGNILSPGADMSLNFKLSLPEPCNGESFTEGRFIFFGEAI